MKKFLTVQSQLSAGLAEFTLPSSSLFCRILSQSFSSQSEDNSEILGKARSTAEEFIRQAREKAESLKETAGEVIDDTKKSVAGKKDAGEEKTKEKKEK